MMASPFAFLRGSAVVMASDLSTHAPNRSRCSALWRCASLQFRQFFATPERNIVFDVNDFDETYLGPFEWDVKRLAASAVVAGRVNGFSEKKCQEAAAIAVKSYRESMSQFAQAALLDVWYVNVDANSVL